MAQEHCCPRLDAADWDGKEHHWDGRPFYRTRYRTLFHIPLNIGGVITRAMGQIEGLGLAEDPELMLAREEGLFGSTLLLSLKEARPGLPVERLSGTYLSRLFQGRYSQAGRWVAETKGYVAMEGKALRELLFWYVTCPRCARRYGASQTVILARVE